MHRGETCTGWFGQNAAVMRIQCLIRYRVVGLTLGELNCRLYCRNLICQRIIGMSVWSLVMHQGSMTLVTCLT